MLLFKLECIRLFSGKINKLVLILFLISGVFAIYQGAQGYKNIRIDQYKSKIVFQKEREHVNQRDSLPEAGSLAYYASAPTKWQLSPWAALFVGESQSSMVATKIRATALQSQIFNREIVNPSQQRAGGLDLGFVLVYLLPLVIGIMTVTLISDEQHAGRWRLLNALPKSAFSQVCKQIALRFAVIWLLIFSLLVSAALLLSLPFDAIFWVVLLATSLYMLFWFSVAGFIMSFGKSSVVNSLAYLSGWVVFAMLIPGAVHLYLSNQFHSEAPLKMSLEQRMVLNNGWDQDQNKQATLDEFLKHEPDWQDTAPLGDAFEWKWYYAQQHMSDLAVHEQWQSYLKNNELRYAQLQALSVLSPALYFQLKLNQLANTSSREQAQYQQQVVNYHKEIRHFFYDYLFFNKKISKEDIDNFIMFDPKTSINMSSTAQNMWSVFLSMLCVFAIALVAILRLKKLRPA
jgi:ABC-2 type transport system permease protein